MDNWFIVDVCNWFMYIITSFNISFQIVTCFGWLKWHPHNIISWNNVWYNICNRPLCLIILWQLMKLTLTCHEGLRQYMKSSLLCNESFWSCDSSSNQPITTHTLNRILFQRHIKYLFCPWVGVLNNYRASTRKFNPRTFLSFINSNSRRLVMLKTNFESRLRGLIVILIISQG